MRQLLQRWWRLTCDCCGRLVDLDEVRACRRLAGQAPRGIRAIPLDAIVGTVGRCCDFDRRFTPLRPHLRRAVGAVRRAFPDGVTPPIDVYKYLDGYFVIDGHKRVAAARAAGAEYVDADVVELR